LVEEAYRSNAGIVTPKFVAWDNPELLLTVGMSADKAGVAIPFGRHELDQEQYDSVRDVFVAPGGAQLIRADLFVALGGFDETMLMFGEDLDISWRAQLAGARVIAAPEARVRHLEATAAGLRPLELAPAGGTLTERVRPMELRHRLRVVLKTYGRLQLLRIVPQLIVLTLAEMAYSIAARRRAALWAIVSAWRWNFAERKGLRTARKATQGSRSLSDRSIRRSQTRGSARLSTFVRGQLATEEQTLGVGAAGRDLASALRRGGLKLAIGVWVGVFAVMVIGSRGLLSGDLAAIGQFQPFPDSPVEFVRSYMTGWRTSGLGSSSPAPVAFAVLGALGMLFIGAMGALQKVLVLGGLFVGIAGAWRVTRAIDSSRGRLVAIALYAAVPLPYDALAQGNWAGVLGYALMPWLLVRMLRAFGVAPWGAEAPEEEPVRRALAEPVHHHRVSAVDDVSETLGAEAGTMDPIAAEEYLIAEGALRGRPEYDDDEDDAKPVPAWRFVALPAFREQVLPVAIVLAVCLALAPALAGMLVVVAAGAVVGGLVAGQTNAGLRAAGMVAAGSVGAAVLLFPWTLIVLLPGAGWSPLIGIGDVASQAPSLGQIMRFHTGPLGAGPLGWAFLVVGALPLVIGRKWRFTWAVHLWSMTIVSWLVAWAAGRGWLGVSPPTVEVLLVPAAAALPLLGALGLAAFEHDLPGYQFGWRQLASVTAAAATALALLPVLSGAVDGRWGMPERDLPALLSWMPAKRADGAFRVLWLGDPRVLPGDPWRASPGLGYITSDDGMPDAIDLWPGPDDGATGLLVDAVGLVERDQTSRLGHLLAPMGVRYIVVPARGAPTKDALRRPPPSDLSRGLRQQVDLRLLDSDEAFTVYENASWAPTRATLPPGGIDASRRTGPDAARSADLSGSTPVLSNESGPVTFTGPLPDGGETYVASAYSTRWKLEVDGTNATQRRAFGWASAFETSAGHGRLTYKTEPLRYAALAVQLVLWVLALRVVFRNLRRHRSAVLALRGSE
ncbi:MAG: glycosyltransferase family 2 protein, partial [Acidimicrobiales bacterium]